MRLGGTIMFNGSWWIDFFHGFKGDGGKLAK